MKTKNLEFRDLAALILAIAFIVLVALDIDGFVRATLAMVVGYIIGKQVIVSQGKQASPAA